MIDLCSLLGSWSLTPQKVFLKDGNTSCVMICTQKSNIGRLSRCVHKFHVELPLTIHELLKMDCISGNHVSGNQGKGAEWCFSL
jgi:hypothetical protein